jgi:hypothetical protein
MRGISLGKFLYHHQHEINHAEQLAMESAFREDMGIEDRKVANKNNCGNVNLGKNLCKDSATKLFNGKHLWHWIKGNKMATCQFL